MRNDTKLDVLWNEVEDLKKSGGGSDLPEVDPTDVGKVLMVGDTGEWEADDLPPQLPEVDPADVGKVLMVGDTGEWEADELSAGGYDITDSERDTGLTIGGSTLYVKKFAVNSVTEFGQIAGTMGIIPIFAILISNTACRSIQISKSSSGYCIFDEVPTVNRSWNAIIIYYTK